jgi:serine/threonine protein kinase
MADSSSVRDLVLRWQELRAQGRSVPAEELCAGHPALLDNVRRQIEALESIEEFLGATAEKGPRTAPADDGLDPCLACLRPAEGPGELGRLGPYRVLRLLGQGGMGAVFVAEDPQLRRTVALKIMKPVAGTGERQRRRFLREAQAAAAVRDDHVVTIYQVGEDRGVIYLVMDLLPGTSLAEALRAGRRFTAAEAARVGRHVALGLAAAHARGLVHRDVKPANLWLEQMPAAAGDGTAAEWRVKLLDFGLARPVAEVAGLTGTGSVLGTPAYMAPEQAQGRPADARSDLFSLGCVLYELATGQRPFKGNGVLEVLSSLALHEPAAPHAVNRAVPAPLSALVMRLLAKRPEDRPAAAAAAELAALERSGANRPGPPAPARARDEDPTAAIAAPASKPPGRRPWALLALAGLIPALLAVLAVHLSRRLDSGPAATGPEPTAPETRPRPVGAPPLPDHEKPFVLLRDGKSQGDFKTLEEVLNDLKPGDAIEVDGNGPFRWPLPELRAPLALRAGPGYRPFFVVPQTIRAKPVAVHVEGCDFDARRAGPFLMGGEERWEFTRCRFWLREAFEYSGRQGLHCRDCLFLTSRWCRAGPGAVIEADNCLCYCHPSGLVHAAAPGGQTIAVRNSTILLGPNGSNAILDLEQAARDVMVEARGNLFLGPRSPPFPVGCPVFNPDWPERVRWDGGDNLYGPQFFHLPGVKDPPTTPGVGLAQWNTFRGRQEPGSRQGDVRLEGSRIGRLTLPELRQELEPVLAAARQRHGLPTLGPDWDLVGAGEAYVRALAAEGHPVPPENLRPKPLEGGSFVLLRGRRAVAGHPTMQAALDAAQDGDTVEVRTDLRPLDGAALRGRDRHLTLRAAPGYHPVIQGVLDAQGASDRLTLEGLDLPQGMLLVQPVNDNRLFMNGTCIEGMTNCTWGPGTEAVAWFRRDDGIPVEVRNCRLGVLGVGMIDGERVHLTNCVLRRAGGDTQGRKGKVRFRLDHCLVWSADDTSFDAAFRSSWVGLDVEAGGSYFVASSLLWPANLERTWQGSGNLYRLAGPYSYPEGVPDLGDWRQKLNSDGDSVEEPPLYFDPQQWRLPPDSPGKGTGPGGKDRGADVERILPPGSGGP